jgi:hypothetical protein
MRDGRIEKDDRPTVDHQAVTPLAGPHRLDKVELLRMLTAHGKQLNEVVDGLSAEEKTELSRVLSSWTDLLPVSTNGEVASAPASRNGEASM